jgi:hypothetical protein
MSGVLKGISEVTGIAASVLAFIPGGQPFAAAASAISAGTGAIAQLTAKPPLPPAQVQEFTFGADQPMRVGLGRSFLTGAMVHHEAHGRDRQDVPNPWYTQTFVLSLGPVLAIDQLYANKQPVDFDPTSGFETDYYDKYLRRDTTLGETPDTTGVNWTTTDPGSPPSFNEWSSARRLSGLATMQFGMLLDDEETQFRSGPPDFGAVGRWSKHYDPRLDSTYPGGFGSCRLGDESTYVYSTNGVIQAATYAYGRYQNGKLVFGGGLPEGAIDWETVVACANVADANAWPCHGEILENGEDGEIFNNIQLMLQTAGAWATNDGGLLRFLQRRPVVTVDTIRADDIKGPCVVQGMRAFKDGFNTVVPTILSESNEWAEVPIDAVGVPTLVASQGETRSKALTYKLVTDPDQASALAVYDIYDTVELDPIELTLDRRFISYNVGDGFDTDLPDLGLNGQTVVVLSKTIDLKTCNVTFGLKTDTDGKHAFALGQTNEAPPQVALTAPAEYELAATTSARVDLRAQAIEGSFVSDLAAGITATEQGDGTWTVSVPTFKYNYSNSTAFPQVDVDAGTITGLAASSTYYIYYDDPKLIGGAVTFLASTDIVDAIASPAFPFIHRVGKIVIPAAGGASPTATPTMPSGTDEDEWDGTQSPPDGII